MRPIGSVFHPAMFASLLGQFAVHLSVMAYSVAYAKALMPDYKPDLDVDSKFAPSVINTVVFLVSTVRRQLFWFVLLS